MSHALRFSIMQGAGVVVQAIMVYGFVEYAGAGEMFAKVLSIGVMVPLNFFLYKFFVYV